MIHRLKTLQPYFDDVKSGKKPFEIRVNDRDYQVGDMLVLEEYNNTDLSTGQVIIKSVTYVLTNCSQYGSKDGYCILGLAENSWIPVSERLPTEEEVFKNDGRFIVTDGNRSEQGLFDIFADGCRDPHWPYQLFQPIAWMPLPEPYKTE